MISELVAAVMAWCCTVGPVNLVTVMPSLETAPVLHSGDVADDAAIWYDSRTPVSSLILATDKQFGLRIYGLDGLERASIAAGRLNNVDLRPLASPGEFTHLAAASNRSLNSISLFGIRADGSVEWLRQREVATGLDYPYGLCMFRQGEQLQVFINDKDGRYQQWAVAVDAPARLLREFRVHDRPEGCEVDDSEQRLFFGIEDHGVYVMDADAASGARPIAIAKVDGDNLVEDVEGISLYRQPVGGYLVVSSQGSSSFAIYDRLPPHGLRGVLAVAGNPALGIDGVNETDGVAAISAALGDDYPQGLLVIQDGHNSLPDAHQNFKIVDWREVAAALQLD